MRPGPGPAGGAWPPAAGRAPSRPQLPQGPVQVAPGGLVPAAERRQILAHALADVELGAFDQRILQWLAGWDACTVLTVASWLVRVRKIGPHDHRPPDGAGDKTP